MYHYTTCGLDNVWLANGYNVRQTPYGEAVSVVDADALHATLALWIAKQPGKLTGKEFRFLRNSMCLSQKSLADMVGVTEQAVSLWERNGKVPTAQDALVRMLVLEKLEGDGKMSEIIDRINTVDRLVNQAIVVRARQHRWTAKAQADTPELEMA